MSSDSSYFENELKSFSLPGASVKFPEDIWFYGIGAPCTPWSKFSAQIVRNGYVNCSTLFHTVALDWQINLLGFWKLVSWYLYVVTFPDFVPKHSDATSNMFLIKCIHDWRFVSVWKLAGMQSSMLRRGKGLGLKDPESAPWMVMVATVKTTKPKVFGLECVWCQAFESWIRQTLEWLNCLTSESTCFLIFK